MARLSWITRSLLPALVAVCAVGSARAEIVTTFNGTFPAQQVFVSATKDGLPPTRAFESPVGPFNFTVVSNDTFLELGGSFRSFCADFFEDVSAGQNYTFTPVDVVALPDVAGPNAATKLSKIQELYDRFYDVATDAERGAAFQLALWEILYDPTNTNLSNGNFFAQGPGNPSSIGIAQNWLNVIGDSSIPDPAKKYDLYGLLSPTAQDQIVPQSPVPAPAGVVLLLIGVGGLIARRRFAAKKAATEPVTDTTEEVKA